MEKVAAIRIGLNINRPIKNTGPWEPNVSEMIRKSDGCHVGVVREAAHWARYPDQLCSNFQLRAYREVQNL